MHTIKLNARNVPVKTAAQLDQRSKLVSWAGGKLVPTSSLSLPTVIFPPSHHKAKQSLSLPTSLWIEWLDGVTENIEKCTERAYQKAQERCIGSSFSGLGIDWIYMYEMYIIATHGEKETSSNMSNQYYHISLVLCIFKSVFECMKMYLSGMHFEHYDSKMCRWCMVDATGHTSIQRQFHPPSQPQNLYPYDLH
jgi:hypothetical protein